MDKKLVLLAFAGSLLAYGCHTDTDNAQQDLTVSPDAGTTYKAGQQVEIKVNFPKDAKVDSVVYLVDSTRIGSKKDQTGVTLKTDSLSLGARTITAKVYQPGSAAQDVTTNIVLLPAKAPEELTFTVEKVFPHDTSLYTEGLIYDNNGFYESSGGYAQPPAGVPADGQSKLVKTTLPSGKIVQQKMIDPKVFGEGIVVIGDKIMMLTWKEKIGYVFDRKTFDLKNTFNNNVGVEGWGMTYDGNKIYMDDSTNRIWFLNKDTYQQTGYIDVYDDKGPVNEINELEYIDGKIYANVYNTENILVIDPKTGAVLQRANMADMYPASKRNIEANVLNGIAYDKATKRIFVTGKKWDKLFQVKFSKK
ncbi:glutaminyl-peptide cyclotransferase [Mucilaginibacter achroorhodeus]|uniref:Glutaminyl-peptide cyclotransferase n=1 Tax=Mucilaginibacter achroorhodeus TaxID=2599294 RepID=A0A563TXD6_9SPHI|nr:glutaminyl-peptide cyclotransferase [Mucilaginibacter achroorhodeus]TWR23976.1 glutaminyl-peptide cyclotransferase [Mucilaginibacter achroorhodeus]